MLSECLHGNGKEKKRSYARVFFCLPDRKEKLCCLSPCTPEKRKRRKRTREEKDRCVSCLPVYQTREGEEHCLLASLTDKRRRGALSTCLAIGQEEEQRVNRRTKTRGVVSACLSVDERRRGMLSICLFQGVSACLLTDKRRQKECCLPACQWTFREEVFVLRREEAKCCLPAWFTPQGVHGVISACLLTTKRRVEEFCLHACQRTREEKECCLPVSLIDKRRQGDKECCLPMNR